MIKTKYLVSVLHDRDQLLKLFQPQIAILYLVYIWEKCKWTEIIIEEQCLQLCSYNWAGLIS